MKYYMTGATGFLSAYIIRDLVKDGHEVVVTDLAPHLEFVADIVGDETLMKQVIIERLDVTDLGAMILSMKQHKPQRVIHMATLLGAASDANPGLAIRVIQGGTYNIMAACVALDVEKLVYASSANVTGLPHLFEGNEVPNDAFLTSADFYGVQKIGTEHLSRLFRDKYGLDSTGLRYMSVYGYGKAFNAARGSLSPFHTELIDNPALGKPGRASYGDALLDWLYVEDAARATILTANAPNTHSRGLNVCGQRATVKEVAKTVRSFIPDAQLEVAPGDWKFPPYLYDPKTTEDEIGYTPDYSLKEGLRKNIDMLRARARLPKV